VILSEDPSPEVEEDSDSAPDTGEDQEKHVQFTPEFRFIDALLVLTGGGPANSTKILPTYLFDVSFQFFKLGRGAAIALTLLLVTIILGMILVKVFESPAGKVNQEGN